MRGTEAHVIANYKAFTFRDHCCIWDTDSWRIFVSAYLTVILPSLADTVVEADASFALHCVEPLKPKVTGCSRVPSMHVAETSPTQLYWSAGVMVQFTTCPLHAQIASEGIPTYFFAMDIRCRCRCKCESLVYYEFVRLVRQGVGLFKKREGQLLQPSAS